MREKTAGDQPRSAPPVRGRSGSYQGSAQIAQFDRLGSLVERCRNIFCRASQLVNAVR
jgi:hypothetical protein